MRPIVLWLRPLRWAMDRVLQWVASLGVVSSVSVITRSTSSSVTDLGRPLRGSSDRPSSLRSTNRERHLPTVSSDTPSSAPTAVLLLPSAHARTILARSAKACAVLGRRTHRSRVSRSSSSKISGGMGRPIAMVILHLGCSPGEYPIPHAFTTNFGSRTLVLQRRVMEVGRRHLD